jgi:hypothetical protein
MLPEVYDEKKADANIISSLVKTIKQLRSELYMVLGDKKGNLYKVSDDDAELLTQEQITELLSEAQADVALLESAATPTSTDLSPAATAQDTSQEDTDTNTQSAADLSSSSQI